MHDHCEHCQKILKLERKLNVRALALSKYVLAMRHEVNQRNQRRWHALVWWWCLPAVGNLIYRMLSTPPGLEKTPNQDVNPYYIEEGAAIEEEAEILERLKVADIEHWGDELINPLRSCDPDGYYPSNPVARRNYCGKDQKSLERKYNFRTLRNDYVFTQNIMVICSKTKQLIRLNECDVRIEPLGLMYWSKEIAPLRLWRTGYK